MSQMSVATTVARRAPRGATTTRTSLQVVRSTDRPGSVWFPLLCVSLLLAGLASVLALNTWMAHDAFELSELEATSARLSDKKAALTEDINDKSSPQNLAEAAADMGMVPASSSAAFIDIENERVLGVASVAQEEDAINVDAASTTSRWDGSSWSSDSKENSRENKGTSEDSSKQASESSEKSGEKSTSGDGSEASSKDKSTEKAEKSAKSSADEDTQKKTSGTSSD